MSRVLLSGNEAAARGAWEAGVRIGVGYPGTPSTEVLQSFGTLPDTYAEWAPNEKVALEVAAGVSVSGRRALVTMKHVGLNVAADPLFTLAYTGVGGGLVLFVADDPGMHSSQDEQDSRNYAAFARVPVLEPSDSAEALAFTAEAFEISERFDVPVIVRSTVRVSHAKGLVSVGQGVESPGREYQRDPSKWVMMPAMARARRLDSDARMKSLEEFANESTLNRVEMRDTSLGVVCSGVCYQYVREALPEASVFKIGMGFPLPTSKLREFADSVSRLVVVEEADAFLARSLRQSGIAVSETGLPVAGELTPDTIRKAFDIGTPAVREDDTTLPPRPPLLCPGCPHRPVFHALKRLGAMVTGDIGCYTLGALKPLAAMDTCVCMGASVGMAHGVELAGGVGKPVVAVIGDSTFAHSGITGLLNTVYNSGVGTICILDNRITAMTGHQGNPLNGITLQGRVTRELDPVELCHVLGVSRVRVVDPQDLEAVSESLAEETAADELSVIIFKAPCALLLKQRKPPYTVLEQECTKCGKCIRLGCPAIGRDQATRVARIDTTVCVGCGQCPQVCGFGAIVVDEDSCGAGGLS